MKYFFVVIFFMVLLIPAYAQEQKNPSLLTEIIEVPHGEFNKVARESVPIYLDSIHSRNWQVILTNELMYANPNGNAVIRLYDSENSEKFIEVGMGGPPDDKFWAAVQVPEEGYVVVHNRIERGWVPGSSTIVSYKEIAGLTVNNGQRIVLSNLDIGIFGINAYSVHGMEGSTDPPAVSSGKMTLDFLSGDPAENIFHLYPFFITVTIAIIVAVLFFTKKRSS